MYLRAAVRAVRVQQALQWRRGYCSATQEEGTEEVEVAEEVFDRNPLSTSMRQCNTRHEVAEFMLKQDPAKLFDTHDLEAARMLAHLRDTPLTSRVGKVMEQMSTRMQGRFDVGKEKKKLQQNKVLRAAKGKDVDKVQTPRNAKGKRSKGSGSVNIYLEFASCYAQICYAYAASRGGVAAMESNPLFILAKNTSLKAVHEVAERAKAMHKIDRPQTVPTSILALGLLGQKHIWHSDLNRYICSESEGVPLFHPWVYGTETSSGWDPDELTNVLWGCTAMGLHKAPDCRRLVQACLDRISQEELLVACGANTLVRVLKVASIFNDTTGPIATSVTALFEGASKRITHLAHPHATQKELKALPGSVIEGNEVEHFGGERILVEDYEDTNYLIGSLLLGEIVELLEAYNASGRKGSIVHKAVAGRVLSSPEVRLFFFVFQKKTSVLFVVIYPPPPPFLYPPPPPLFYPLFQKKTVQAKITWSFTPPPPL